MKKNISKDIMLGLYVAVGLLLFIGIIYFIGSRQNLFGSTIKIHAVFNDVSGLQAGNNVRLSGIKIGTVQSVDIISDSSVNVTMLIDKSSGQFVKTDAFAAIESNGLMGNKVVSISSGSEQSGPIKDGDKIKTNNPADFDQAISSINTMTKSANELIANLVEITNNISDAKGLLGKVMTDSTLAKRVEKLMYSLEQTGNNSEAITEEMQGVMKKVNQGKGLAARALNDTAWARNVDVILDSTKMATENLGQTTRELNAFLEKLNKDKGAVNTVLTDTTMAEDLKATMHNINKGTQNLDEVMTTVQNSWLLNLFGKNKKKEKEKAAKMESVNKDSTATTKPQNP